jgi:hypothetical protein
MEPTKKGNFHLFDADGKRKFVFSGWQTINGNQRLLFQQRAHLCLYNTLRRFYPNVGTQKHFLFQRVGLVWVPVQIHAAKFTSYLMQLTVGAIISELSTQSLHTASKAVVGTVSEESNDYFATCHWALEERNDYFTTHTGP